jgi:DNA-binding SARP family transcriptional activator
MDATECTQAIQAGYNHRMTGQYHTALKIHLLGRFEVWREGILLPASAWPQKQTQALLKILVSERGHSFTQDQLIDAIFPHLSVDKAGQSLRARLSELRRLLEPRLKNGRESQYIISTGHQAYYFDSSASCWLDTETLHKKLETAQLLEKERKWSEALQSYQDALSLYRGDFLSDDLYEEWTLTLREKWKELYQNALARLADCHAHLGQYDMAVEKCLGVLHDAPAREPIYRQLMLYYSLMGDKSAAIKSYQSLLQILRAELELSPSPETRILYQQILDDDLPKEAYPAIKKSEILKLLQGVPLFWELSEEERVDLWNHCELHEYAEGDYILQEGDVDNQSFFLVIDGQVEIRRGTRSIARQGKSSTFGEIAQLTKTPRSADVIALKKARCLLLAPDDLKRLIQTHPEIALKMMSDLAHRVREMNETLRRLETKLGQ